MQMPRIEYVSGHVEDNLDRLMQIHHDICKKLDATSNDPSLKADQKKLISDLLIAHVRRRGLGFYINQP